MSLERLKNCLAGLESTRLQKKRSEATELLEIIQNDQLIKILNENHLKHASTRWDHVIRAAHIYSLQEADKFYDDEIKKKTSGGATELRVIGNCKMMIVTIVQKARDNDYCYLSRKAALQPILQVLDTKMYHKYFLQTYLNILTHDILPATHFRYHMKDSDWVDLIDVIRRLVERTNHQDVNRIDLLRALIVIFQYIPSFMLRTWAPLIVREWQLRQGSDDRKSSDILKMTNIFCQRVAIDCRMCLCQMGEAILSDALRFYENRVEDYGGVKTILFDFLLLQITLHHPNGATENSDLAYAHDWAKWKDHIRCMYGIIFQEIDCILRMGRLSYSSNKSVIWSNFTHLAVEFIQQYCFNLSQTVPGNDEVETAAKRGRKINVFEMIVDEITPGKAEPWLCILNTYLKRYSSHVTSANINFLLSRLLGINFSEQKERFQCFNCYINLLEIEENFENIADGTELSKLWSNVWESAVSSFGHHENEEICATLIQKLIQSKSKMDITSLLRIYESRKLTKNYIEVLNTVLIHSNLSNEQITNIRNIFWESILKPSTDNNDTKRKRSIYRSKITAHILAGFCLKEFPIYNGETETPIGTPDFDLLKDFETIYRKTNFMIDKNDTVVKNIDRKVEYRVDEELQLISSNYLCQFLDVIKNLKNMTEEEPYEMFLQILDVLIFSINIINFYRQYNIIQDACTFRLASEIVPLLDLLLKYFGTCCRPGDDDTSRLYRIQRELLENLNLFFDLSVPNELNEFVYSIDSMKEICQKIISLLNVETTRDDMGFNSTNRFNGKIFDEENMKRIELVSYRAWQVLCNFVKLKCNDLGSVQRGALKYMFNAHVKDVDHNSLHNNRLILYFIRTIANSEIPINEEQLKIIFENFKNLYLKYEHISEIVLILLSAYNGLSKRVQKFNLDDLKNIAVNFLESFKTVKDPMILKAFLYSIQNLIQINPAWNWKSNVGQHVLWDKMVDCLYSDYHELRIITTETITYLFKSPELPFKKKLNFLEDINRKIEQLFELDELIVSDSNKPDEIKLRTSTAVFIYTMIMCANVDVAPYALFALLRQSPKISSSLFTKGFEYLTKTKNLDFKKFISGHFEYLLDNWYKIGHNILDFPYKKFGYSSEKEFFAYHIEIITKITLKKNMDDLDVVCQKINKTVQEIIQSNFPLLYVQILPLVACKDQTLCYIKNDIKLELKQIQINLEKILSEEEIKELRVVNIFQIILSLIQHLNDFLYLERICNIKISNILTTETVQFDDTTVTEIIEYLEREINDKEPLIVYFALNFPAILEKLLLKLSTAIYSKISYIDQLIAFQHYIFLCKWIQKYLAVSSLEHIIKFLIRNISYNLIHIIISDTLNEQIRIAACHYFNSFCDRCIQTNADIFKQYFHIIVNLLMPTSIGENTPTELRHEVLKLLKFLIIDKKNMFVERIALLESFPTQTNDTEVYSLRQLIDSVKYSTSELNLKIEIENFLKVDNVANVSRLESLRKLRKCLTENKNELFELYKKLEDLPNENMIHKLINSLINLAKSTDNKVALAATMCLGEIGPLNLQTLILKVDHMKLVDTFNDDISIVIAGYIIRLLMEYTVENDYEIKVISSRSLYAVLASHDGQCTLCDNHKTIEYNDEPLDADLLVPFLPTELNNYQTLEFSVSESALNNVIQQSNLWWPLRYTLEGHENWLKDLVCSLLRIFEIPRYFTNLIPLCRKRLSFCEKLLPLLIELCLCKLDNDAQIQQISNRISLFFENFWNKLSLHRQSLRTMLNVVNFNKFRSRLDHISKGKNFLKINYLHVAKASLECSAYFTAVFYIENWCRDKLNSESQASNQHEINMIEALCTICPDEGKVMQEILREAYTNIGDMDAVNGCGISHLLNLQGRTEHYSNLGYWDQAVLYYDINLSASHLPKNSLLLTSMQQAYLGSLKKANLYHTANVYANCTNPDFECLWRMSDWDVNTRSINTKMADNFEKFQYLALKSVYKQESVTEYLTLGRECILKNINNDHMETTQNLYVALSKLQLLQEIEDFHSHFASNKLDVLTTKWTKQKNPNIKDFMYLEPIYAQRITLLEIAINKTKDANTHRLYQKHLVNFQIDLAEVARKWKCYQVAKSALFKAKLSNNISPLQKIRLDIEEAELEWNMGLDKKIGPILLHKLLQTDFGIHKLLYSKALRLYGTWMMETRSENPDKYLTNALKSLDRFQLTGVEENENRYAAYAALAKFASDEFQQLKHYLKSQAYEIKKSCIANAKEVVNELRKKYKDVSKMSDDERRLLIANEKNIQIDETDISNTLKMFNANLVMAVKYYLLGLKENDQDNLSIFRLIALWIENRDNDELDTFIGENLRSIPSYKFLPVLPQIAPHISNDMNDRFVTKINDLIERCCIAHPFHVLPLILAIANANKDNELLSNAQTSSPQPRVQQAELLIKKLKKDQKVGSIVENMLQMSLALIQLAYMKVDNNHKRVSGIIPSSQPVLKLKNLSCIHIPTLELPVQPSENYDGKIIGIYKWDNKFVTLSGKSAPKRITCIGTDGVKREQLIKGLDDLRQDAVMQQVFNILNTILKTKYNRDLLIRTYKIVPLSQKSGLIQMCENAIILSEYLLKHPSAHERYHPDDYKPTQCLKLFGDSATKDNEQKLQIYNHICSKFRPVFHKFFWENYGTTPASWWEHRRAYTLSVATTSMVGYILGLGDRHLSNIMIDKGTGEIIHIDFGIAFEQGRILPTPETVPFRLTRDIEDGMGISGVEGVFRRSCEKTMVVLRENHEIILTILQVLLYDPLYMWKLTPSKAIKVQRGGGRNLNTTTLGSSEDKVEVNKMAERALLRLTQKLQGTEDGHVTSIEGQVEKLIQEARNPVNLCRLYYGWQPFA